MVPNVVEVTHYVKHHFGDVFKQNGPSSPLRPVYPCLYPKFGRWGKHVRKILWEASFAHDAGFWMLSLPGSPYHDVTRKEWNKMYRNHIRDRGHRVIASVHYLGLKIGSKLAWKKNQKKMRGLGYTDLQTWAAIKRTQSRPSDPH